jgi:hypothetical protein
MYAAVIKPHPALLGPFAILLLSFAIFRSFCGSVGNSITKNCVRSWPATTCGCYVFVLNGAARVQHAAGEYATFIVVVGTFLSRDPPRRSQMSHRSALRRAR